MKKKQNEEVTQAIIATLRAHIESFDDFNKEDRELWLSRIAGLSGEQAAFLINFFEDMPEEILNINANFKEKERVFKEGGKEGLKQLIQKEKEELLNRLSKDQ